MSSLESITARRLFIWVLGIVETKWEGIERVVENRDYLFVYIGSLAAYIIPIHVFTGSNQKEEFKNTLNTMIGKGKEGHSLA